MAATLRIGNMEKAQKGIHSEANTGAITMTAQKSMRQIRTKDDIKELVDHAFPLELKVPNAETLAAMEESRAMMSKRRTRFASVDERFADLEKTNSE
jgi:hypothetical protein